MAPWIHLSNVDDLCEYTDSLGHSVRRMHVPWLWGAWLRLAASNPADVSPIQESTLEDKGGQVIYY